MTEENAGTQTVENLAKEPPEELAEQANAETQKAGGRKAIISAFDKAEIEFVKPLTWCGKTYEKASLDFSKLTGVDMEAIDEELGNESPAFPAQSRKYRYSSADKKSPQLRKATVTEAMNAQRKKARQLHRLKNSR